MLHPFMLATGDPFVRIASPLVPSASMQYEWVSLLLAIATLDIAGAARPRTEEKNRGAEACATVTL